MKDAPELSFILPAYDEEENIEEAVRDAHAACLEFCSSHELIVVDDGSRDRTPEILRRLAAEIPQLRVIRIEPNGGYTNALRTGFAAANRPWVFYTDGDNQFDPREMARFLAVRHDSDLVIGHRIDRKDGGLRYALSRGYNGLQRFLLGLDVHDINCAFKLFRREFFAVAPIRSSGFLVDAEMLVRATRLGLRIRELPVGHRPREGGSTTVSWRSIPQTLRGILQLLRLLQGWPSRELLASLPGRGLGTATLPPPVAANTPRHREH